MLHKIEYIFQVEKKNINVAQLIEYIFQVGKKNIIQKVLCYK